MLPVRRILVVALFSYVLSLLTVSLPRYISLFLFGVGYLTSGLICITIVSVFWEKPPQLLKWILQLDWLKNEEKH